MGGPSGPMISRNFWYSYFVAGKLAAHCFRLKRFPPSVHSPSRSNYAFSLSTLHSFGRKSEILRKIRNILHFWIHPLYSSWWTKLWFLIGPSAPSTTKTWCFPHQVEQRSNAKSRGPKSFRPTNLQWKRMESSLQSPSRLLHSKVQYLIYGADIRTWQQQFHIGVLPYLDSQKLQANLGGHDFANLGFSTQAVCRSGIILTTNCSGGTWCLSGIMKLLK